MNRYTLCVLFYLLYHSAQAANIDTISLWPNHVPPKNTQHLLEKDIKTVSNPFMAVYQPIQSNQTAILVISGGGYAHEVVNKEGTPTSLWLQQQGFTAFELVYRLPTKDHANTRDFPFADAQRALRLIKATKKYQHVAVMGFSAGGHIAGMLATQWTKAFYDPIDSIDDLSARPDFAVLLYPIVSMHRPFNHTHAYKVLFSPSSSDELLQQYSVDQHVTDRTPPMFIAHAIDDRISPVASSQLLDNALKQQQIRHQLILFNQGGHGWGLGRNTETQQWPALFLNWQQAL